MILSVFALTDCSGGSFELTKTQTAGNIEIRRKYSSGSERP